MIYSLTNRLLSILLSLILITPYVGSLLHLLENHHHETCNISEVHLHQIDIDCDIYNYYFTPNIDKSNHILIENLVLFNERKISINFEQYTSSFTKSNLLRAPPLA